MNDKLSLYWEKFLADTGRPERTKYVSSFYFDLSERVANALLALVLEGKKRATCSSLYAFEAEGEPVPAPGDLHIITDFAGNPHCVIETQKITIMPFREMTFDLCSREGEDDTLESWRQSHIKFFTEDGAALGYAFSWDMPVVFEEFQVVYTA